MKIAQNLVIKVRLLRFFFLLLEMADNEILREPGLPELIIFHRSSYDGRESSILTYPNLSLLNEAS